MWKIRSQNFQVKCTNDKVSREQGVIRDSLKKKEKEKQRHMAEGIDKV